MGAGRAAPPPPHIKCVILRIQRGYLMHKYLGHRYFIAQVFRIRILGSSLYLYLYFGYRIDTGGIHASPGDHFVRAHALYTNLLFATTSDYDVRIFKPSWHAH